MYKLTEGLDKAAIQYAAKKTAWRITTAAAVSGIFTVVSMQMALGYIHPIGLACGFLLPIFLSTAPTLTLHLKNQQLRAANKRLDALASTDTLTGAMTRRAFAAHVAKHINPEAHASSASTQSKDCAKDCDKDYALLLLDVDKFKSVNDAYGHEAGDLALQLLVRSIRHRFGEIYPLARYGGEEFAMFLPDADVHRANAIAEEICKKVSATNYASAGIEKPITVSIGVATSAHANTLQQLYTAADKKLYEAKDGGRNCVKCSTKETSAQSTQTAA